MTLNWKKMKLMMKMTMTLETFEDWWVRPLGMEWQVRAQELQLQVPLLKQKHND